MPTSPSSSAQAARTAVAHRLRDLRKEAGLTIVELATACGWHYSKTSRIENGQTGPSAKDIRRWCAATEARAADATDLIAQSLNAEAMYREWRQQMRVGLKAVQESLAGLFRETRRFRVYSSTVVPGLLQTEGYARGVLAIASSVHELPLDEVEDAVQARLGRSRIIHAPGRRFAVVIEESVLRHRLADEDAMAAQLGFLLAAGALPAVSLGVIPMATRRRTQWPEETFAVYDDKLVTVELVSAEVTVTQPSEVEQYLKSFERLRSMAVYGAEARTLIVRAIDALR
ncbi:helix-turn-helix domain-containing protein [Actinacidiphila sp. bgisy145]|uniref:helix-turn-helix domain-containing protein n=1 Tax=Actinacidiphila sp. bgisy145 TaxID=3413792 RepID=UPI003EB6C92E